MQDTSSTYQAMKPQVQFPEHEHLKCPRCDSTNTKFCYYNNYNLSQPRHFCKNCRRYWTKGGALRNIPVGGGSRKNTKRSSNTNPKRSSTSTSSSSSSSTMQTSTSTSTTLPKPEPGDGAIYAPLTAAPVDQDRRMLDITGSFSSLLASNGQFGTFLEGMNSSGSSAAGTVVQLGHCQFGENLNSGLGLGLDLDTVRNPGLEYQNSNNSESFLGVQSGDSSCWSGGSGNGWPDLAMYTPGSTFQ